MKRIILTIIAINTISCTSNTEEFKTEEKIEIRLNQKPRLSDFIEAINYHALPKEVTAGYFDKVLVTKDNYIFADYEMGMNIHVFDKQFNLISKIDNAGEGPGEYQRIKGISYNEELDLIEVLTNKDIIQFSSTGNHLNTRKTPFSFGNILTSSNHNYIIYNNNSSSPLNLQDNPFTIWDFETKKFTPIVKGKKMN